MDGVSILGASEMIQNGPGHPDLFHRTTVQQVSLEPVLVRGIVPPQVQDPTLSLVELHQVPLCPTLQRVQVSLDGSTVFQCIHHSSQFCVISKLAEGTLCPFIQLIDYKKKEQISCTISSIVELHKDYINFEIIYFKENQNKLPIQFIYYLWSLFKERKDSYFFLLCIPIHIN